MSGYVRFIVDKKEQRYTSKVYTSCVSALVSHHSLWISDWERYSEILSYYEVIENDELNKENIIDHYGMVYINWENKEIHQFMDDYAHTGFSICSMKFELAGQVRYSEDLPQDCFEINTFLLNLKNKYVQPEIECYAKDKNDDFVDFHLYFTRSINSSEIADMILNYRKIEGTPQLMEKYGLEASIDLSQFDEIIMNRFPLATKDWSLSTHKDWSENWEEISSNINDFPTLADEL